MRTREEQHNDPRFAKELQHERHIATGAQVCVYIEEKPTGLPEGSSQTVGVYSGHWSTPNWNHEVKRYVTVEAMEKAILEAEQRGYERARAECAADTRRLEWLDSGCCDVRFRSEPIADTGDADTHCDIIEHHMAEPKERIVGSGETIRRAIDAAMEGGK